MSTIDHARQIQAFLSALPEVKNVRLYGSLADGTADHMSDIDLEIDVSGTDNGKMLLRLPDLFAAAFPMVFFDYAPSLAPDKYVVTLALQSESPFAWVDIACTAQPHCPSVSRADLMAANDPICHLIKLFAANLKHFLRGQPVSRDIHKMYTKTFGPRDSMPGDREMLMEVFDFLKPHARPGQQAYLDALLPYLRKTPIAN